MSSRLFEKQTREMVRFYTRDELSLRQIAPKFNISHQAVHLRLVRAGVSFRPAAMPGKPIGKRLLKRLHIDEGLPVYRIAKQLRVAPERVRSEMERYGIDPKRIPNANRRYPQFDTLKVGESVEIPFPTGLARPYGIIYSAAQIRGIRLSVRTVETMLKVTRKA